MRHRSETDERSSVRTFTERIDAAVSRASAEKRGQAITLSLFLACLGAVFLAVLLSREAFLAPMLILGLLTAPLVLLGSVAIRRPPGVVFWWSLLLGGALLGAGPLLEMFANGWEAEVYMPGRWGSGSLSPLSTAAPFLWGMAGAMIVSGLLGVFRAVKRRRTDDTTEQPRSFTPPPEP